MKQIKQNWHNKNQNNRDQSDISRFRLFNHFPNIFHVLFPHFTVNSYLYDSTDRKYMGAVSARMILGPNPTDRNSC